MKLSITMVATAAVALVTVTGPALSQTSGHRLEIPTDPADAHLDSNSELAREAGLDGDFVVIIRKERLFPGRISETRDVMSWNEFVAVYGLAEQGSKNPGQRTQDGDGGIPTPGPPPDSFDWEAGDQVIYTRYGQTSFGPGRRTTEYRHNGSSWERERNDVDYCDADFTNCRSDPQPKVGF